MLDPYRIKKLLEDDHIWHLIHIPAGDCPTKDIEDDLHNLKIAYWKLCNSWDDYICEVTSGKSGALQNV